MTDQTAHDWARPMTDEERESLRGIIAACPDRFVSGAMVSTGGPDGETATLYSTSRDEGGFHEYATVPNLPLARLIVVGVNSVESLMAEVDSLRALVAEGIEAFRLTKEYTNVPNKDGFVLLPDIEGWSHYDWTVKARAALGEA